MGGEGKEFRVRVKVGVNVMYSKIKTKRPTPVTHKGFKGEAVLTPREAWMGDKGGGGGGRERWKKMIINVRYVNVTNKHMLATAQVIGRRNSP